MPSQFAQQSWISLDQARWTRLENSKGFLKMMWLILGINPACISSPFTPGAICWILILEHIIATVDVKFSCQNSFQFQNYLKTFIGPNFHSCWFSAECWSSQKNTCWSFIFLNYLVLGWILTSRFMFGCLFSIRAALFFTLESRMQLLTKLQIQRISYFLLLSVQLIKSNDWASMFI